MRTIDVLPSQSDYALVSAMPAKLGCSLRTVERDLSWAMASELSPFADYQKGRPLDTWQQRALFSIREGRRSKLPAYLIAEKVEALSKPQLVTLDQVAQWLKCSIPEQYRDKFIQQLYEDLGR